MAAQSKAKSGTTAMHVTLMQANHQVSLLANYLDVQDSKGRSDGFVETNTLGQFKWEPSCRAKLVVQAMTDSSILSHAAKRQPSPWGPPLRTLERLSTVILYAKVSRRMGQCLPTDNSTTP